MGRQAIAFLAGAVVTVLVAIAVWLVVVYTGAYNVAASDRHADPVRWTLDTVMHRSVASRADAAGLPDDPSRELLSAGAAHYEESCAHCHGAPGQDPARWSRGMRPEPPHLAEAATHWSPAEIHWIVTNGTRMSGMPAFGEHHDAEEIVALTAFVSALPGLTSEDYAALTGANSAHGAGTAHESDR
jgi:mono/diheme cytochrome c family protein